MFAAFDASSAVLVFVPNVFMEIQNDYQQMVFNITDLLNQKQNKLSEIKLPHLIYFLNYLLEYNNSCSSEAVLA